MKEESTSERERCERSRIAGLRKLLVKQAASGCGSTPATARAKRQRAADAEARRIALPQQLQGQAAGQDMAPAERPRRAPKHIDRLIERADIS